MKRHAPSTLDENPRAPLADSPLRYWAQAFLWSSTVVRGRLTILQWALELSIHALDLAMVELRALIMAAMPT